MVRYEQERVRRRRNSITRDEIVRVARELAEQHGEEALTIRAVATAMDAAPMSLYTHVATKEDLLDAVLDDVLGDLTVRDGGGPWRDELRTFALALASHLETHTWAVLPLMSRPDPGDRTTAVGEVALGIALRGGLSERDAVTAFVGILSLVYGRAAFIAAATRPNAQSERTITARISAATSGEFPATARVSAELVEYSNPRHLDRAVGALIYGLARSLD